MRRTAPDVRDPRAAETLAYPPEEVIAALEPLLVPARRERLMAVARGRLRSVTVVLEAVLDPHNVGAILRTSDAMGVGELHLVDRGTHPLLSTRITKGCERWLDLHLHKGTAGCVEVLRARGFALFVADARGTHSLDALAEVPKVALVFGNEHDGASSEVRAAADGSFAVPMRGMVESLNVSVAAAIALHAVTHRRAGDLPPGEARAQYARYLFESARDPAAVIDRWRRERG